VVGLKYLLTNMQKLDIPVSVYLILVKYCFLDIVTLMAYFVDDGV